MLTDGYDGCQFPPLADNSKIPNIMELKIWLSDQGLTVRELAQVLDVPLKTAQDWVYRGKAPSAANRYRLTEYVFATCAHHWVIEPSNGPTSGGVCRRCGQNRDFQNSIDTPTPWQTNQRRKVA